MADEEIYAAIKAIEEKIVVSKQFIQQMEQACATLRALVNGKSEEPVPEEHPTEIPAIEIPKGPLTELSQRAAVREILKDAPKGKTPEQIHRDLVEGGKPVKKQYVHVLLYRMKKAKEIRSRGSGKYILVVNEPETTN
ncbi:MAG: hypothetical protein C4532_07470 [Candidatus Abyssobacteria bacterium SURF_17]|uniref:Uncharacterized protein n=1 Tax=Candidatus Abyssobacteria bacterium SURF_17 TaxID=2093361 RepID=A0A419F0S1_9BACT|nr:MAG: hypothetical protein C4532_07470 [Candidatus Abyssubacteria bacterium SURF_17]